MWRSLASPILVAVLADVVSAQGPPGRGNLNDLVLQNGGDVIYGLASPTPGPVVGVNAAGFPGTNIEDNFASQGYFWKVYPAGILRHCSGTMEVTGLSMFCFDTDWSAIDGSGNNCVLADILLGPSLPHPDCPTATILPNQTVGLGDGISFGKPPLPGDTSNAFLPPLLCPLPGLIKGYELDVDLTNGGIFQGLTIVADGATDLVITVFEPGGQQDVGPSTCDPTTGGDRSYPGLYSASIFSATEGETPFDLLGSGGMTSAFGGLVDPAFPPAFDFVSEVASTSVQFREPCLSVLVDSNTGHGVEEGMASMHFDWTGAGAGGKLGTRLYAWQGVGKLAVVYWSLALFPTCANFKGGQLGIPIAPPLGGLLLGPRTITAGDIQTDGSGGALPPLGPSLDGTCDIGPFTLPVAPPLPACGVPLHFQAFYAVSGSPLTLEGSQVRTMWLH